MDREGAGPSHQWGEVGIGLPHGGRTPGQVGSPGPSLPMTATGGGGGGAFRGLVGRTGRGLCEEGLGGGEGSTPSGAPYKLETEHEGWNTVQAGREESPAELV